MYTVVAVVNINTMNIQLLSYNQKYYGHQQLTSSCSTGLPVAPLVQQPAFNIFKE